MNSILDRRVAALEAVAATCAEPWAKVAVLVVFADDGNSAEVLNHPTRFHLARHDDERQEAFEKRALNAAHEHSGNVSVLTRRQYEAARTQLTDEFTVIARRLLEEV